MKGRRLGSFRKGKGFGEGRTRGGRAWRRKSLAGECLARKLSRIKKKEKKASGK